MARLASLRRWATHAANRVRLAWPNSVRDDTTVARDALPRPLEQSTADVSANPQYAFDAFASYATDPDRDVVREVESFLESLPQNTLIDSKYRRSLEICVDGSDFTLPRRAAGAAMSASVGDIVTAYLQ